jgi:ammonia channel protein AmtB
MTNITGLLGGLVSITSAVNVVEPLAAIFIGSVGSVVYLSGSILLKRWHIDDVIDAVPIHLGCGIWAVLSTGLFASQHVRPACHVFCSLKLRVAWSSSPDSVLRHDHSR